MEPQITHKNDWRSLITMVVSGLAILYFIAQALLLSGLLLISGISTQIGSSENVILGSLIWYSVLSGVLLIPVFLHGLFDYRQKTSPNWMNTDRPVVKKGSLWLILALPVVFLAGWLTAGQEALSIFLLGMINILVTGIPVLWIYLVSQNGIKGGSQGRKWRIFGFSFTIMPFVVMIVELFAILILVGFVGIWMAYKMSINPQLQSELLFLSNKISQIEGDLDGIVQLIQPYILQPGVIFWVIAISSGIIPLIEELLKPIAIWSLAGRKISPQEGFVSGVLCGAGFALLENLLYFQAAVTPGDWLLMALGRIGTAVLHILVSGLVGWGMARTWWDGKWIPLIAMTLGAVALHGFWNALALLSGIAPMIVPNIEEAPRLMIVLNAPLVLLSVASLMGIFLINRHFRRENQISEAQPDLEGEDAVGNPT